MIRKAATAGALALAALAVTPAAAQRPNQQQAIEILNSWDTYAVMSEVAYKCPILEPWKLSAYEGAMKRREAILEQYRVDYAARRSQALAEVTSLDCRAEGLAALARDADRLYGAALLDLGGWYAQRNGPCGVGPQPPVIRGEVERVVAEHPALSSLMEVWADQARRDAQCPAQIRDAEVRAMLIGIAYGRASDEPLIALGYPRTVPAQVQAFRLRSAETPQRPQDVAVAATGWQDPGSGAVVSLVRTAEGKLVAQVRPGSPTDLAHGVELQFFDGPEQERPYAVFKPERELAPEPQGHGGVMRRFQFGVDAEQALETASRAVRLDLAADTTLAGQRQTRRRPAAGPGGDPRWPAWDLQRAWIWASTPGAVGAPLKP